MALSKSTITRFAGRSLARFIAHVTHTSQIAYDPPDLTDRLIGLHPCILAFWHGQFMMLPELRSIASVKVAAMVARHGDAELIGEALQRFDIDLIRGAGAGARKKDRGGAAALRASVRALDGGATLAMTADVPPGPARWAGLGIITIAQLSGCPIVPVTAASSRMTSFDTWSRMTINLPYSKLAYVIGEPIRVPRDASAAALEDYRLQLESGLNDATARAYALVGADIARATPLDRLAAANPPAPGLSLRLYRSGLSLLRPVAPLLLKYRARQGKEDPARRAERLGGPAISRPPGKLIWVHAASVGETNVALPVIQKLLEGDADLHVLLTTGTTTSAGLAARRLPERAFHQFVPLDAAQYARSFLSHWQPDLAIFTESEIWPNLILEAAARRIPLTLINARMSPGSMKRWRRNAKIARPLFSRFALVLTQNDRVTRAIRFLGAPKVVTAGNLKIDAPPPPVDTEELARLKAATAGRPLLLAASTHPGEDEIVAEAHTLMRAAHPDLLTLIVPRHPDRAAALQEMLAERGFKVERRTQSEMPSKSANVFIADTIGELGTFYALAPVAFIGGSLVPHGGQNPIEAVRHGAAVISGPYTHNFQDFYSALLKNGGAMTVTSAQELSDTATQLISNAAAHTRVRRGAEGALQDLSGALEKTLAALRPYLEAMGTARRAP